MSLVSRVRSREARPQRRAALGAAAAMTALLAVAGCQASAGAALTPAGPSQVPPADAATPAAAATSTEPIAATDPPPTAATSASTTGPAAPSPSASPSATLILQQVPVIPLGGATGRVAPPAAATAAPAPVPTSPAAAPAPATVPVAAGRIRPGVVYSGPATLYGVGNGAGNCLFDASANPPVPVVAMNEQDYDGARACGAYLEVTGPGGTTTVLVTDRCPECVPGQLDMSKQAFDRVSGGAVGRINKITWRLASPAGIGNVQFKVKKESSQWWVSLQVRNHRNPIATLEVRKNGSWVAIPRQMYNFFEADGLGAGPYPVRITDVYGQQLVDSVNLAPNAVQTTNSQFAQH